jgi:hypothetical protein
VQHERKKMQSYAIRRVPGYKKGIDLVVDMPLGSQVIKMETDKRNGKTMFTVLVPLS